MELSSAQVCERAGVSYRQLDYWRRNGVISWQDPDELCPGSGVVTWWDEDDARVFSILANYRATVPGSALTDLSGLAWVAHKCRTGFAVRVGEEWEWRPDLQGLAAGEACFVAVALSQ